MNKTLFVVSDDEQRRALVDTLAGAFGLERVAADACRRAGLEGREQQLMYCLAVLAIKESGGRGRYGLQLDADDFGKRLAAAADTVAGHLRDWGAVHEAIQDEFLQHRITTVRAFVRVTSVEDVVDAAADQLAAVLAGGPRPQEMTLALAREEAPARNEYVFQSPLDAWIRLSINRRLPPDSKPLAEPDAADERDLADVIAAADEFDEALLREVVTALAREFATRALLAELIERADGFEREVARMRPASRTHELLLGRLRATIVDITDRLRAEQRALGDMLAYIALAMVTAAKLQAVTILSLRAASIEPAAIAHMSDTLRALLTDERQPTPALVARTQAASDRGDVSSRRASALVRLRTAPRRRARELAGVSALLAALPPLVTDNASIAAALPEPSTARIVAVNRHQAGVELHAVDRRFGHLFRRYALDSG